jgi:branched-chain amino acid transport system permease protein
MRAVSENPAWQESMASTSNQVIRITWVIGAGLACVAGVMAGLLVQIRPYMGFDLLLPLFAAAILGGIGSIPGRHARRPDHRARGSLCCADHRRGMARRSVLHHSCAGADAAPAGPFRPEGGVMELVAYAAFFLTVAMTYAIICLGLNVQWGQTGLFNVGIAGFVGVGAYVSAALTTPDAAERIGGFDLPIARRLAAAMISGAVLSLGVGLLTLRMRADYLAITTFGIAVALQLVFQNTESLTGGAFGLAFIPRPFASLQGEAFAFNIANLASPAVVLALYLLLEHLAAKPVGPGASRRSRRRGRRAGAGQESRPAPVAGLCTRRSNHGAGRRCPGPFHRLHRTGQLSADDDLSGLGHADRRRLRQQPRRHSRRSSRLGNLGIVGPAISEIFPADQQARAASLQIVIIGVMLCIILLWRPQGILPEIRSVSRHLDAATRTLTMKPDRKDLAPGLQSAGF